jgi:arylsulfatase A-like enzyme
MPPAMHVRCLLYEFIINKIIKKELTMKKERPNIIFINTDEQRYDTIAELGFPYMDTPNLDKLAREGTLFTNCFNTAPTCGPSRHSVFTGYYPHTTGMYNNENTWKHSWVESLANKGYYCVNIGKMHTSPYETPLGFHERFVVENKDRYLEGRWFFDRWDLYLRARGFKKPGRESYRLKSDYKERLGAFEWELPDECHPDFFVGDLAKWWIETKPKNQPLFLEIGFPGPHPPFDPIPRYAEPYLKKDLPLPQVTKEEIENQPGGLKEANEDNLKLDHDSIYWLKNPTKEQLHRMRAYYFANVTMIDEKIGEIINALKNRGYLDNTVIIFTTDHGDCLGDHGHIEKWNMFDQSTKIPLIVWAPGRFKRGQRINSLIQNFDIAPVIMELAGIDVPESWQTETITPALEGKPFKGREYVFSTQADVGRMSDAKQMTMIRNSDWKLVHYLGNNEGELYDLKNDPGEHRNLWFDENYKSKKQELIAEMLKWQLSSNYKAKNRSEPWR